MDSIKRARSQASVFTFMTLSNHGFPPFPGKKIVTIIRAVSHARGGKMARSSVSLHFSNSPTLSPRRSTNPNSNNAGSHRLLRGTLFSSYDPISNSIALHTGRINFRFHLSDQSKVTRSIYATFFTFRNDNLRKDNSKKKKKKNSKRRYTCKN